MIMVMIAVMVMVVVVIMVVVMIMVTMMSKAFFFVGPRVHFLTIIERLVKVWAPAVLVIALSHVGVVVRILRGILSSKVVQLGHEAHLLDWFPLNFGF